MALDPTWIRGGSDSGSDIKRWGILHKSTQILSYPHQDCSSSASFFHCRSNLFCQAGSDFLYPMPPERPAGKARAKAQSMYRHMSPHGQSSCDLCEHTVAHCEAPNRPTRSPASASKWSEPLAITCFQQSLNPASVQRDRASRRHAPWQEHLFQRVVPQRPAFGPRWNVEKQLFNH